MSKFLPVRAALLLSLSLPAAAQQAEVTDSEVIKLGGQVYRLWGIYGPVIRQTCSDGWAAWTEAVSHLQVLTRDRRVVCERKTTDQVRQVTALCRADGADLSAEMVRLGMAWALGGGIYVQQEGRS